MLIILPFQTWAWEYNPSLGFGLKYGGIAGFQAALSTEKHNLRAAAGFFGISAGYDYKFSNNISLGATTGKHADVLSEFEAHTLNITYFVTGKYSQGWNVSVDIGKQRCTRECIDDDLNDTDKDQEFTDLTWFSLGYSF